MTEQYIVMEVELHGIGKMDFMSMSKEELLELIEDQCNLDEQNINILEVHEGSDYRSVL